MLNRKRKVHKVLKTRNLLLTAYNDKIFSLKECTIINTPVPERGEGV